MDFCAQKRVQKSTHIGSAHLSLHKPSSHHGTGDFRIPLKEEESLFPTNHDRVPITLTSGFFCRCLADIEHAVNLIHSAVLPRDR